MKSKKQKLAYVIHEHHASHLHWDLRLEHKGVLKSWAVPKKPPVKINEKRLAVQVANHAIEYAKFHGMIKEGYGKGKVLIWDRGWYEIIDWKPDKKYVINIHGRKLKGKYCIARFMKSGPKNWLFFKIKNRI